MGKTSQIESKMPKKCPMKMCDGPEFRRHNLDYKLGPRPRVRSDSRQWFSGRVHPTPPSQNVRVSPRRHA